MSPSLNYIDHVIEASLVKWREVVSRVRNVKFVRPGAKLPKTLISVTFIYYCWEFHISLYLVKNLLCKRPTISELVLLLPS